MVLRIAKDHVAVTCQGNDRSQVRGKAGGKQQGLLSIFELGKFSLQPGMQGAASRYKGAGPTAPPDGIDRRMHGLVQEFRRQAQVVVRAEIDEPLSLKIDPRGSLGALSLRRHSPQTVRRQLFQDVVDPVKGIVRHDREASVITFRLVRLEHSREGELRFVRKFVGVHASACF